MVNLKKAVLAASLIVGATSLAFAQDGGGYSSNGMPPASYKGPGAMPSYPVKGNTAANAAASGGSGAHQSAPKTGSAENSQKVFGNQNGYASTGMPPASYKGPGAMQSYPAQSRAAASGYRSGHRGRRRLYSSSRSGR